MVFRDGTLMAEVVAIRETIGTHRAGCEHWYINEDSIGQLGTASLILPCVEEPAEWYDIRQLSDG